MKCTKCGGELEKERWKCTDRAVCRECQRINNILNNKKNVNRNKRNIVSGVIDSSHIRNEKSLEVSNGD